jgi:hypothetical protein
MAARGEKPMAVDTRTSPDRRWGCVQAHTPFPCGPGRVRAGAGPSAARDRRRGRPPRWDHELVSIVKINAITVPRDRFGQFEQRFATRRDAFRRPKASSGCSSCGPTTTESCAWSSRSGGPRSTSTPGFRVPTSPPATPSTAPKARSAPLRNCGHSTCWRPRWASTGMGEISREGVAPLSASPRRLRLLPSMQRGTRAGSAAAVAFRAKQ